ncbi:hypothetical protein [Mesorhizobium sp. B4-1-3]|uniref:hypothetical protein n=1 Tax=Mesorhizobium sp. B4-1-3 TaxID=2589889 RepID=UPI0015E30C17|nr:hypothetical protein [Mesorhizobium sp. B4-1-3]
MQARFAREELEYALKMAEYQRDVAEAAKLKSQRFNFAGGLACIVGVILAVVLDLLSIYLRKYSSSTICAPGGAWIFTLR